jgi:hypothetical protein
MHTAKRHAKSDVSGLIREGHKAGLDIGYFHIEKLHNLKALPADGFFAASRTRSSVPWRAGRARWRSWTTR